MVVMDTIYGRKPEVHGCTNREQCENDSAWKREQGRGGEKGVFRVTERTPLGDVYTARRHVDNVRACPEV